MAFVDNNSQDTQSQVAGASPLSTGTNSAPMSTEQAPNGSTGSTIQSQAPEGSNVPQSGTTNKKAPKASSGMFTNIQKYVDKNKPQAQKMAESSLENIRQSAENQKRKQEDTINQFTQQAQASGLQNTQQQVQNISDYTRQQAGLAPNAAQSSLDDTGFQNIINAQYQGPKSLSETGGLFQQLQKQAAETSRVGQLAQSLQGREQLLKEQNTKGGRDYSAGASQLDAMLLNQQTPILAQMEAAGRNIGSADTIMQNVGQQAQGIAGQTAADVLATKEQARQAFQNIAGERQGQVDQRVGQVIDNWDKLPAYFRDALSNPDGTVNLSAVEAATLGVQSGEGLYNLSGEDLFGTSENPIIAAEKARLISTGEQGNLARLQALSNLAQTGQNKLFDIGDYYNADLAGTQTAFDALNLPGVREQLAGAEQKFRDDASKEQKASATDYERYDRGWGQSRGKAYGTANVSESLKDLLANQGYDFDSEINSQDTSNIDVLKNLANLANMNTGTIDTSVTNQLGGVDYNELADSSGLGQSFDDIRNIPSNVAQGLGEGLSNMTDDLIGQDLANITGISPTLDLVRGLGGAYNDVTTSLFGGGKSSARKKAQASAEKKALSKLQNQLQNQFTESGFQNRVGVADTQETQQRTQALMNLLANLDKTNA